MDDHDDHTFDVKDQVSQDSHFYMFWDSYMLLCFIHTSIFIIM